MTKLSLNIKRVIQINPKTKDKGYATRVVTNGSADFDELCKTAGRNTTMHPTEIRSASTLFCEAAAEAIKSGMIVDLGPLGKLYPAVNGKWTKLEDEQVKADLTPTVNYRPSEDISLAVKGAALKWVGTKDDDDRDLKEKRPLVVEAAITDSKTNPNDNSYGSSYSGSDEDLE